MTEQRPITPPPELVQQLIEDTPLATGAARELHLITVAYQAGADQELEACCEWLAHNNYPLVVVNIGQLRAARRPKPPSLKQQALEGLKRFESMGEFFNDETKDLDTIRRALEALPND